MVYKTLPHYRVAFFEGVRSRLAAEGIRFRLIVGQPDTESASRYDTTALPWAESISNRALRAGNRTLIWQPVLRSICRSDLVIVEQASRLLVNPVLATWRRLGGPKFALWGHGINRDDSTASRIGEWWKRRTIRSCDWWFAYTEGTAALVSSAGFASDRITIVQNAIDTAALAEAHLAVDAAAMKKTRSELGIGSPHVAVYVGSLYAGKRLGFLIAAADIVRLQLPDFELLIIGDGPHRTTVETAAATRPWLHVLGVRRNEELARLCSVATVMLMPGLVGLAVLDSFALELPMITSAVTNHSPEIEYLEDGRNGVIVLEAASERAYASAVVATMTNQQLLDRLCAGCREAAMRYTVEEMVERFSVGVQKALAR